MSIIPFDSNNIEYIQKNEEIVFKDKEDEIDNERNISDEIDSILSENDNGNKLENNIKENMIEYIRKIKNKDIQILPIRQNFELFGNKYKIQSPIEVFIF